MFRLTLLLHNILQAPQARSVTNTCEGLKVTEHAETTQLVGRSVLFQRLFNQETGAGKSSKCRCANAESWAWWLRWPHAHGVLPPLVRLGRVVWVSRLPRWAPVCTCIPRTSRKKCTVWKRFPTLNTKCRARRVAMTPTTKTESQIESHSSHHRPRKTVV